MAGTFGTRRLASFIPNLPAHTDRGRVPQECLLVHRRWPKSNLLREAYLNQSGQGLACDRITVCYVSSVVIHLSLHSL